MRSRRLTIAVLLAAAAIGMIGCGSSSSSGEPTASSPLVEPTATATAYPLAAEDVRPSPVAPNLPAQVLPILGEAVRRPPEAIRVNVIPTDQQQAKQHWREFLADVVIVNDTTLETLLVLCGDGTGIVGQAGPDDPSARYSRGSTFEWDILRSKVDPANSALFTATVDGELATSSSNYPARSALGSVPSELVESIDTRLRWSDDRQLLEHDLVEPEYNPEFEEIRRLRPEAIVLETDRCSSS